MPDRSSSKKPPSDPVDSAYATMQRIIEQTEADPSAAECLALRERVAVLQHLCHEVLQFAKVGGLPGRVIDALHDASIGASVLGSVLPITPEDLNAMKGESPAIALGRAGGLKGGKARANALSARRRKEIARKAAAKRWRVEHDKAKAALSEERAGLMLDLAEGRHRLDRLAGFDREEPNVVLAINTRMRTRPIRDSSTVGHARRVLRTAKRPMHIDEIVRLIQQMTGLGVSKATLVSNLSRYVKTKDTFKRTAPNTFGLIDEVEDEIRLVG